MCPSPVPLPELRRLIGRQVCHRGITCDVIELLEDIPALVLMDRCGRSIQDNQYGEPQRVVPQTYTVPILNAACDGFSTEFSQLGLAC